MALIDDVLAGVSGDAAVKDLRVCLRTTAVWSRRLGLAYTFPRVHGGLRSGQRRPRRLGEMSARELAELARSTDLIDSSVGVAALNSLVEPDEARLEDGKALDVILERGEGKDVTVVGHFPFVDRLRPRTRNLWVLELDPREGDLPASEAATVIPKSDVVAITGTSLINGTLDELLELSRGRYTLVLGPSTVLSEVLLDAGVDAVCGSLVVDPEAALACVSEGDSFRYMEGLRPVVMTAR